MYKCDIACRQSNAKWDYALRRNHIRNVLSLCLFDSGTRDFKANGECFQESAAIECRVIVLRLFLEDPS